MGVRELPDDNVGGRQKPVQVMQKNLLLLTAADAGEGYSALPLARVRHSDAGWERPLVE